MASIKHPAPRAARRAVHHALMDRATKIARTVASVITLALAMAVTGWSRR